MYRHGNMTQFLGNDATAAKVLPRWLHSSIQLNRVALGVVQHGRDELYLLLHAL